MTHAVTGFRLAICLAILSAAPAFSQATDDDAIPDKAAAHIYIQDSKGVDVYRANAAGQLTLVKGSPFPIIGAMEDVNGKYLISIGKRLLHSYPVASNGALGEQVGKIDTQAYGGSQCGMPADGTGSVLNHTGKYLYVSLYLPAEEGDGGCAVWQTFHIEPDGQFQFLGYVESFGDRQGYAEPDGLPTVSSNDRFAYATQPQFEDGNYTSFTSFKIASNGELEGLPGFESLSPQTPDGSWFYYPTAVAADNAGHLAAVLNWFVHGGAPRLASYTIESDGSIQSTNTSADMPAVSYNEISMSLSGKLLAVNQGSGFQIFHFNGSAPITQFSSLLLPTVYVSQMAWDLKDHLYVLDGNQSLVYVYTVTPTSISEVAGSPFEVASGSGGMIVVVK